MESSSDRQTPKPHTASSLSGELAGDMMQARPIRGRHIKSPADSAEAAKSVKIAMPAYLSKADELESTLEAQSEYIRERRNESHRRLTESFRAAHDDNNRLIEELLDRLINPYQVVLDEVEAVDQDPDTQTD